MGRLLYIHASQFFWDRNFIEPNFSSLAFFNISKKLRALLKAHPINL